MMPHPPAEEILEGGQSAGEVVRRGDTVHRSLTNNSEFVHAVLKRLEEAHFTPAPRFLGIDEKGWEVLSYRQGEVFHDVKNRKWSREQLSQAILLLKGVHDATAETLLSGPDEVVCHNDYAPWNVVFANGVPKGIIDFDECAPGSRMRDFSYAAWCWLGLGAETFSAQEQAERLVLLCEAYGLEDRSNLLKEIRNRQEEIKAKHLSAGRPQNARWVQDDIDWMIRHQEEISLAIKELG